VRPTFARTVVELAERDERICGVIGDVGFGVLETFASRFPDRWLNVGVAEANLAGVSAGLALAGARPFMYSIANFPTLRCLEQIRNDICYNRAPVVIVGVGGGLAYGSLGATHHATEDLAVMRAIPGLTVIAPADPMETELLTRAAFALDAPVYLRLGRSGDPAVHQARPDLRVGRGVVVREGADVTLIATGAIARTALDAAELLAPMGISARVVSMHTLKPLDVDVIRDAVERTGALVTLEEHSLVGGLGSAVAEAVADHGLRPRSFLRLGLPDAFAHVIGSRDHLLARAGLSASAVARAVAETRGAVPAAR
jgi:transketolase